MDIPYILTTVTESVKLIKTLNDVDRSLSEADLKMTIANVTGMLADTKAGISEMGDEIRALKQEIERLQSLLAFRGELVELHGFKYDAINGAPVGFPYCPACEVTHQKFYRIAEGKTWTQRACPHCRFVYGGKARFFPYPD
jgi:hypothetical protein